MVWTGRWPGETDCEELGLWCKWQNGWVPCAKDDPQAMHDLNSLALCKWNRTLRKWERR